MALNLDAVKQKLNQLHEQSQRRGPSKIWKPTPGDTVVRILPSKFNEDYPFCELLFHFAFKKPVLALTNYGETDPVQEFAEKLQRTGDSTDRKEGKKLEAKTRIYVPIIVRGKEDEGIKYWGFGKEVYNELLNYIADPDYGDITDLHEGRDITVTFTEGKNTANGFASTSVRVKPKVTAAASSKGELESLIEDQVEIDSLFSKPSYDELLEMLQEYLTGGSAEDTNTESSDSDQNTQKTDKKISGARTLQDVQSQFGSFFEKKNK